MKKTRLREFPSAQSRTHLRLHFRQKAFLATHFRFQCGCAFTPSGYVIVCKFDSSKIWFYMKEKNRTINYITQYVENIYIACICMSIIILSLSHLLVLKVYINYIYHIYISFDMLDKLHDKILCDDTHICTIFNTMS